MRAFKCDPNVGEYDRIRRLVDVLEAHGIPLDMSLRELRALNAMTLCFIEHHPVTQSEIAAITGLPKPTISRYILNWLQLGWLTEFVDEADRRRKPLMLTESAIRNSANLTLALSSISLDDRSSTCET